MKSKMKIGFTGTRQGLTEVQHNELSDLFYGLLGEEIIDAEVHHGGCVGADEEFHNIATLYRAIYLTGEEDRLPIVIHPAQVPMSLQAAGLRGKRLSPKPPLERNHDIVDETDVLIATPFESEEQQRGGTWSTIRYARKLERPIYIVLPDGTVKPENTDGQGCAHSAR